MRTIYKYPLFDLFVHGKQQQVEVPKGANLLNVAIEKSVIDSFYVVWFKVDTEEKRTETYTFYMFWTGHPIPPTIGITYLCTLINPNNNLVEHIFWSDTN